MEVDPKKRIKIDEILSHPWVKNQENGINYENINFNNNTNVLFTKAEKIIYFKLRKDYREINNTTNEGNLETFTYKNIDTDYQDENLNANTMSFIHTPYNSRREKDYDEDLFYDDVNIEKDIMKFLPKVNEMNRLYEINNNCDFDHGYINKDNNFKKKIMSSFNESYLKKQNEIKNKKDEDLKDNNYEIILNNNEIEKENEDEDEYDNKNNKDNNFTTNSNTFNFDNNAIKYVENFGYKRDYIIKSLEANELNHATATYYLKLSLNDE